LLALDATSRKRCPGNVGRAANWPGGKDQMKGCCDDLCDAIGRAAGRYRRFVADLALAVAADYAGYADAAQIGQGRLDFDDLLGRCRDLLKGHGETPSRRTLEVRRSFQERFQYLLVDEFQDTDPLQAEIVFFLAEGEPRAGHWRDVRLKPGKLFLVGDPKQSIYRFRRADIAMYGGVKSIVARQGEVASLEQNFRTVPSVIAWVNQTFRDVIGEQPVPGLQEPYAAIAPKRGQPTSEPSVVVVADDRDLGGKVDELAQREAGLIAGLLGSIESQGWRVLDRDEPDGGSREHRGPGRWRDARLGDVTILLPVFTRVGEYEQALRAGGIPYRIDGGQTYFKRREVVHVLAVLQTVDAPADQALVYGALHADPFAFSDDELFAYRHAGGSFDYLGRQAAPDGFADVGAALDLLRRLHLGRNVQPITATIDELLRDTHYLEQLATWSDDPEQAIGNIDKLVALADDFGASAGGTFQAFVAKMQADSSAAETAESPVGESGDFVRIMTIHKAKGLEFPITVLAGLYASPRTASRGEPIVNRATAGGDARRSRGRLECSLESTAAERTKNGKQRFASGEYEACLSAEQQAQEHERRRQLYVAATRAADLLVIPHVGLPPKPTGTPLATYLLPHLGLPHDGDGEDEQHDSVAAPSAGGIGPAGQPTGEPVQLSLTDAPTDPGSSGTTSDRGRRGATGLTVVRIVAAAGRRAQLAPPPPPDAEPLARRETWRQEREALLRRASRRAPVVAPSSLEQLEPSDWHESVAGELAVSLPAPPQAPAPSGSLEPALESPATVSAAVPVRRGRAHALAQGTAVHLVMERVGLDDEAAIDDLARAACDEAGHGAGVELDRAAVAALARSLWRAAALRAAARVERAAVAAGETSPVHRELPFAWRRPGADGLTIEGAIDLAFCDDERGGWVIVDYKTDADPDPGGVVTRYGGQAAAYALALGAVVSEPVVAVDVVLAALPDTDGAATTVTLVNDENLAALVDQLVGQTLGIV
ncbi:MAG TPA: UvrD-helicase domain-containing protein, partial [Thermoleophilia bacterium]|nr:UvrD-helicase domain-containing protein [Thermoleophilia bacterium]